MTVEGQNHKAVILGEDISNRSGRRIEPSGSWFKGPQIRQGEPTYAKRYTFPRSYPIAPPDRVISRRLEGYIHGVPPRYVPLLDLEEQFRRYRPGFIRFINVWNRDVLELKLTHEGDRRWRPELEEPVHQILGDFFQHMYPVFTDCQVIMLGQQPEPPDIAEEPTDTAQTPQD